MAPITCESSDDLATQDRSALSSSLRRRRAIVLDPSIAPFVVDSAGA